jgi:hypothetical protein
MVIIMFLALYLTMVNGHHHVPSSVPHHSHHHVPSSVPHHGHHHVPSSVPHHGHHFVPSSVFHHGHHEHGLPLAVFIVLALVLMVINIMVLALLHSLVTIIMGLL